LCGEKISTVIVPPWPAAFGFLTCGGLSIVLPGTAQYVIFIGNIAL
jgi:hypothetical protein